MRQIGDDARVNPFNIIKCEFIGDASAAYKTSVHHNVFYANKVNEKALQFCAKKCWTSETEDCANTCVDKFKSAFEMYNTENRAFIQTLNDIQLNGGDKNKSRGL